MSTALKLSFHKELAIKHFAFSTFWTLPRVHGLVLQMTTTPILNYVHQVTSEPITITARTLEMIVSRNFSLPFVEFRLGETKDMEIFIADEESVKETGLILATPAWDIGEPRISLSLGYR